MTFQFSNQFSTRRQKRTENVQIVTKKMFLCTYNVHNSLKNKSDTKKGKKTLRSY